MAIHRSARARPSSVSGGSFERMGLLPYFLAVIEHSPPSHQAANMEMGETSDVIAPLRDRDGSVGVRISSELGWVTARPT